MTPLIPMLKRYLSALALAALGLFAAACGNSQGAAGNGAACAQSNGGSSFCLTGCSLGCTTSGCAITDISTNLPITMVFSQAVDKSTVNFSTISIQTASGRVPEGRFDVNGNVVEFVPEIRVKGGVTTFGFVAGETYLMTLPDGSNSRNVLRSVKGDLLGGRLSCSLRVTRGIVDLDQSPPVGDLVSPTATIDVASDALVVVEFSEVIDTAPFRGGTTESSPIQYLVRQTVQDPLGAPGDLICDPNSAPLTLQGVPVAENFPGTPGGRPPYTVVSMRPTLGYPSRSCIQVVITGEVRDLAGNPAARETKSFITEFLAPVRGEVSEFFFDDTKLDKSVSTGRWGGGKALAPALGGTGALGKFNIQDGMNTGPGQYEWNTDSMVVRGQTVTGGVFDFTSFELGPAQVVDFVGSNPAVINVQGSAIIEGRIRSNGMTQPFYNGGVSSSPTGRFPGQVGAPGGAGGGKGGAGGEPGDNMGPNPAYNGLNGSDMVLLNGHAYLDQVIGTGGRGSAFWPSNGIETEYLGFDPDGAGPLLPLFGDRVAAGGGGGGFDRPGTGGQATQNPTQVDPNRPFDPSRSGPPSTGGIAFDLGAFTPPALGGNSSLNFYSVGGSGGGGGGSHSALSKRRRLNHPTLPDDPPKQDDWIGGAGGGGGGGVLVLRIGQDLIMKGGSVLQARGGGAYRFMDTSSTDNVPAPGGGGSGGTVLVQVGGGTTMNGLLDVAGGASGLLSTKLPSFFAVVDIKTNGGTGAAGYYRLEKEGGAALFELGSGNPPATQKNVGTLTDSQSRGASQSRFYTTRKTVPPQFLYYELEVELDGVTRVFSDNPDPLSPHPMPGPNDPLQIEFQGAMVNALTGFPNLESLGPWVKFIADDPSGSVNDNPATGFRYRLIYDSQGGTVDIAVRRVSVHFIQ